MTDSILVEAHVEWQVFGNVDAQEHLDSLLSMWQGAGSDTPGEPDHYLRDYGTNFVKKGGPFGLQFISFWVVTPLNTGDAQQAKAAIKARLDRMVGDSDIDVRWVEVFQS